MIKEPLTEAERRAFDEQVDALEQVFQSVDAVSGTGGIQTCQGEMETVLQSRETGMLQPTAQTVENLAQGLADAIRQVSPIAEGTSQGYGLTTPAQAEEFIAGCRAAQERLQQLLDARGPVQE
ncbi:hypothetical protein COU79_00950 [Candidatus Peregrinibacteria bacterium CG10_big_fil_rev_8_21_14_0_10_54_7]|nr:MAG: hypothetical protein COU79_00950 [Candidatus Peregrinibacteria bacterium CG10_big_fil_rev_8_21_14_0_10_54_7]